MVQFFMTRSVQYCNNASVVDCMLGSVHDVFNEACLDVF